MPKLPPAPQEKAPPPPVENENTSDKKEDITDDPEEPKKMDVDDDEENRENQATENIDTEAPVAEQTSAENEDTAVEASQKPVQQIDFIPSWANAFSRLFTPFSPNPVEPDLELGHIKDIESAECISDLHTDGEQPVNQMESHGYQPLEHLKNSLSKIFPMSNGSTAPSVDFSRRSWWMPQVPVALPSWFPGQNADDSAQETCPEAADPLNREAAARATELEEATWDDGCRGGEDSRGAAQNIKRRPRSGNKARLPLTLRVSYRELRKELWGEAGRDVDDEMKAALAEKRRKWVRRFHEKAPVWAGRWDGQEEEARQRLSGRLVQLVAIPCLCTGGFVLYLALAYGIFPLTP